MKPKLALEVLVSGANPQGQAYRTVGEQKKSRPAQMDPDLRSPTGRGNSRKRRRVEDEGVEAEDGEAARTQAKLLACPYHKVFPDMYSRVKSCKAGYAKIHRLK